MPMIKVSKDVVRPAQPRSNISLVCFQGVSIFLVNCVFNADVSFVIL